MALPTLPWVFSSVSCGKEAPKMGSLPNKREMLKEILSRIGVKDKWKIIKPSPLDPEDIEHLCIFQNPEEGKEIKVALDDVWFQDRGGPQTIERELRKAFAKEIKKKP